MRTLLEKKNSSVLLCVNESVGWARPADGVAAPRDAPRDDLTAPLELVTVVGVCGPHARGKVPGTGSMLEPKARSAIKNQMYIRGGEFREPKRQ